MLRTNLSTRPFYNERIVHLLIALAGIIVLAITLFNVVKVVDLSRHNTELSTRIGARSDRRRQPAARGGEHPQGHRREGAHGRRGRCARSQHADRPADVLVDGVLQSSRGHAAAGRHAACRCAPAIDRGATRVSMVVVGRTPEDIDEFIEKLEATGAFDKILPRQTDKTDEGLNRAVLDSVYTPEQAEPAGAGAGEADRNRGQAEVRQSGQAGDEDRRDVQTGGRSGKRSGPGESRGDEIMSLTQRIFEEKRAADLSARRRARRERRSLRCRRLSPVAQSGGGRAVRRRPPPLPRWQRDAISSRRRTRSPARSRPTRS